MDDHAEHPYPPHSRSIYQLSTTFTSTRSPTSSPSHHIFPPFDTTAAHSAFLSQSPINNKLPTLPHSTFTFPPSSLLPACPLSPTHSLFDGTPPSSSSSAATYSRPSSPIPADPYIASILSSPSDYSFPYNLISDELSEPLSDVGDIGCVVLGGSSPSSPSCTSPWSNGFEVSGGECDGGSTSGGSGSGSDSEGRADGGGGASDGGSTTMGGEQDSQPTTDDDDSFTAASSPTSPLPTDPIKRRRKPTAKQQQQLNKPATAADKGRKRRLTATSPAPPPHYDECEVPEDKRERNKQSASDYRKRRKVYVTSLEQQLNELKAALRVEREEGKKLRGENTVLRASMQMMREFVQGKQKAATTTKARVEKREVEKYEEEDEEDEEEAEAAKRWETAVSVRVPEEYRPVAPSQQVEDDTEQGASHTHNTRKRRGRTTGKQHKVGMTLFVLFSCFLLYFPLLADLSSSPLLHTPSTGVSTSASDGLSDSSSSSLFYNTPPDCVVQPNLCNRGRAILNVIEDSNGDSDVVHAWLDELYATSQQLMKVEGAASVKVEEPVTAVDQSAMVMSPLSLPISAHNASAAASDWLGGDDLMLEEAAAVAATYTVDSQYDDMGWSAASDGASMQYAL